MTPRRVQLEYRTIESDFRDRYKHRPHFQNPDEREAGEADQRTPISGPSRVEITYGPALAKRPSRKKKRSTGQKLYDKARVTSANGWILSWAGFWYLTFQLPLAVLSTAGLGIAAYVYSLLTSFTQSDGVFTGIIDATVGEEFFFNLASIIVEIASRFYGLAFDPVLLFMIPFALLFGLGLLQLAIAWFIYAMLGLNPLSGSAATAKIATFILALIGTMMPILNLFPLIFLWCAVVWWRPK